MSYMKGITSIVDFVTEYFKKNPDAVKAVGYRLKKPSINASGIGTAIRNNPTTAALVALEMGAAGNWLLDWSDAPDDDEKAEVIRSHEDGTYVPSPNRKESFINQDFDPAPSNAIPITDLHRYRDELRLIREVVMMDGGMTNLEKRRAAYELPAEMFTLYNEVKGMKL